MAINANTTQRRLVAEIKEWSDSHQMIDRFGYGDFLELYSNSKNSYPYFTLNIKDATSSQWYFNFTLEICVIGWLYDNKEGQLDSESELIEILRDFQNTVKVSPRWQSFARIQGDMTLQKVLEKGGDKALAWCGRMTVQIKKTSGFCSLSAIMPEYDFENGIIINPVCAPVSIFENMIFKEFVPSGGEFYYTTLGADSTQIIEDSASNILYTNTIPSGDTETQVITDSTVTNSDSSYNSNILAQGNLILPDVTNTDSDGTLTPTPAQTAFVCTPQVKDLFLYLNYLDTNDVIEVLGDFNNIGTYTIIPLNMEYSTNGINYVALTNPFTLSNTVNYYFKRLTALVSETKILEGTYV